MALPENIYDVIDPESRIFIAGLHNGWANRFRQPRAFYLGGLSRLLESYETVHATENGEKKTIWAKYRDFLDYSLFKKMGADVEETKNFYSKAYEKIPAQWKTNPDFNSLPWTDTDLSCEQLNRAVNLVPMSFVKCCHVLAVIDAILEVERSEEGHDPRLDDFEFANQDRGIRIMPAIFIIGGFNSEYYRKNLVNRRLRDALHMHVGIYTVIFWEHLSKNHLPATYRTLEKIVDFCEKNNLPSPGTIHPMRKLDMENGRQPRFKPAKGEIVFFP